MRRRSWLPPRVVRRVLLAPLVPLVTVLALVFLPLQLAIAAVVSRFLPGRPKVLRLVWLALVWMLRESVGVVALFGLWLASGFGARLRTPGFQRQHIRLLGWYLWGLVGAAQRTLGLRLVTEESPGILVVEPHVPSTPVLVFSRHSGAGDSVILAHELVNTYGRTPAVVLKDTLQWAPCIDIALHRFPNRFIPSDPAPGEGVVESIGQLAGGLPGDGALILFPEGGNFSDERRSRAIAKLVELGLHREAAKARELRTLLPPRPGGALAALEARPDADVVFVAHTGLEALSTAAEVLAGIPLEHSVRMAWWRVPAADIPAGEAARIRWLYEWWERIDTWVEGHAEAGLHPLRADIARRRVQARRPQPAGGRLRTGRGASFSIANDGEGWAQPTMR